MKQVQYSTHYSIVQCTVYSTVPQWRLVLHQQHGEVLEESHHLCRTLRIYSTINTLLGKSSIKKETFWWKKCTLVKPTSPSPSHLESGPCIFVGYIWDEIVTYILLK